MDELECVQVEQATPYYSFINLNSKLIKQRANKDRPERRQRDQEDSIWWFLRGDVSLERKVLF